MKKRLTVAILIILIVVWTSVFWEVYRYSQNDEKVFSYENKNKESLFDELKITKVFQYSELSRDPFFQYKKKNRNPIVEKKVSLEKVNNRTNFKIDGLIKRGSNSVVVLRNLDNNEVVFLKKGDSYLDITVVEIQSKTIELKIAKDKIAVSLLK
ncbi:MAG: hypothetical protein K8F60_01700 [Melioribacteraceae bacterium]|jgi:type II secretory pathway component PulC|nr:hypothetical protein [Melioribacteraceae bacterium]